ncbi:MAG: putative signal transducing protein [Cyclobacteriaceae bacterium]
MNSNWQRVYSTNMMYRAEIVKAVLEDNHLNPVLIDKQDTSYHFGQIEIYVAAEEVIYAMKIIEDDISFK